MDVSKMKDVNEIFYALMPNVEAWLRGVVSDEVLKALEAEQAKKRPPRTYTRREVAAMAHISLPTLWSKMKAGKIIPLKSSGRRVLFSEDEVRRFLKEG